MTHFGPSDGRGHTLRELFGSALAGAEFGGARVTGLATDSREVVAGDLFLACRGEASHGRDFIERALLAGAAAIAVEVSSGETLDDGVSGLASKYGVAVFAMEQLTEQLGRIAAHFFGDPSDSMRVIGVTGTNGKTSCSQFIAQCLHSEQTPCAVVGTLGNGIWGHLKPTGFTTPLAIALQRSLAEYRAAGARFVSMEVSSHGLEQGRTSATRFEVAVLTNLSRDHLDYHGDMAAYADAKRKLFHMAGLRVAVLNLDDAFGREVAREIPAGVARIGYSVAEQLPDTDFPVVRAQVLQLGRAGQRLGFISPWGEGELHSDLLGRFNAANLTAVLACLLALDIPFATAMQKLAQVKPPPGRMERFGGTQGTPLVVVDYAHTPDALEQVLGTLREHCRGKLWAVFGCGGDRDRGKRPQMGAIAQRLADVVVLTDDNPRSEDAREITAEILRGMPDPAVVVVQHDREKAIGHALSSAGEADVVLVAGKGHEDYQIVGNRRRHFSDRAVVCELLEKVA